MKVYIYSKAEFNELDESFLKGKRIIRIFNQADKGFIKENQKHCILYFEDLHQHHLLLKDKFLLWVDRYIEVTSEFITYRQTKILLECINNHNQDFIIHCEYGKSRSVAIGKFIIDHKKGYQLANRDSLKGYNDFVYNQMKKFINNKLIF